MARDKMIRQANQIAQYFSVYPQQRAEEGVLGHIRKFWEPRIRRELVEHLERGGDGLHPLVLKAAEALRDAPDASARATEPAAAREIGR